MAQKDTSKSFLFPFSHGIFFAPELISWKHKALDLGFQKLPSSFEGKNLPLTEFFDDHLSLFKGAISKGINFFPTVGTFLGEIRRLFEKSIPYNFFSTGKFFGTGFEGIQGLQF